MNHRKLFALIAIAVAALIVFAGLECLEYYEYPFPPKTLSTNRVNEITGINWSDKHTELGNSFHTSFHFRDTLVSYNSGSGNKAHSLIFYIYQCANQSQTLALFKEKSVINRNTSTVHIVQNDGAIHYNYSVAYWNAPYFSQITAYYNNFFIKIMTLNYLVLSKSTMLGLLNAQAQLLNESNPYFYNW